MRGPGNGVHQNKPIGENNWGTYQVSRSLEPIPNHRFETVSPELKRDQETTYYFRNT